MLSVCRRRMYRLTFGYPVYITVILTIYQCIVFRISFNEHQETCQMGNLLLY